MDIRRTLVEGLMGVTFSRVTWAMQICIWLATLACAVESDPPPEVRQETARTVTLSDLVTGDPTSVEFRLSTLTRERILGDLSIRGETYDVELEVAQPYVEQEIRLTHRASGWQIWIRESRNGGTISAGEIGNVRGYRVDALQELNPRTDRRVYDATDGFRATMKLLGSLLDTPEIGRMYDGDCAGGYIAPAVLIPAAGVAGALLVGVCDLCAGTESQWHPGYWGWDEDHIHVIYYPGYCGDSLCNMCLWNTCNDDPQC